MNNPMVFSGPRPTQDLKVAIEMRKVRANAANDEIRRVHSDNGVPSS